MNKKKLTLLWLICFPFLIGSISVNAQYAKLPYILYTYGEVKNIKGNIKSLEEEFFRVQTAGSNDVFTQKRFYEWDKWKNLVTANYGVTELNILTKNNKLNTHTLKYNDNKLIETQAIDGKGINRFYWGEDTLRILMWQHPEYPQLDFYRIYHFEKNKMNYSEYNTATGKLQANIQMTFYRNGSIESETSYYTSNNSKKTSRYMYDGKGYLIGITEENFSASSIITFNFINDPQGNPIQVETCETRGGKELYRIINKTEYVYDSKGNWTEKKLYYNGTYYEKTIRKITYY